MPRFAQRTLIMISTTRSDSGKKAHQSGILLISVLFIFCFFFYSD